MKYIVFIICILLVSGCSIDEELKLHNNIEEYQGIWRDTIHAANDVYIEDLIINDNSVKYTLTDAATHIILDTLSGILIIGNENKIGWNCISPINNENRQTNWEVLDLSTYHMRLYSKILGEHNYRRVYHPTIEDLNIQDTLSEMLGFQKYLPLQDDDLIAKFGTYNRIVNNDGIAYFTHHPLFDKVSFIKSYDNDSIYSYILSIKDWNLCVPIIKSNYIKFRDVGVTTEYIDSELLETSHNVVISDSTTKQMSFKPIKEYDYWPNVSRYIGKNLSTFMDDYQKKYVYRFHENIDLGLYEYSFQTHRDSICTDIFVGVDSNNIIKQSGVCLIKTYLNSRKKEAQKELEKFAVLLNKKYFFDRESVDDNGNKVYYYYPNRQKEESPYEIRLRLRQYQNGITKIYQVAVNYILL